MIHKTLESHTATTINDLGKKLAAVFQLFNPVVF